MVVLNYSNIYMGKHLYLTANYRQLNKTWTKMMRKIGGLFN
jgi:hypothetical protein